MGLEDSTHPTRGSHHRAVRDDRPARAGDDAVADDQHLDHDGPVLEVHPDGVLALDQDRAGQGLVEYAMILILAVVLVIVILVYFALWLNNVYMNVIMVL